jgi:hypothetical protein
MSDHKFISVLGKYFGEAELTSFLAEFEITDKPKLKRGDTTAHLSNESLGVELTFRDADALRVKTRNYPDGALVLSNVRFYGDNSSTYKPFAEPLPLGVVFGDSKSALLSKLGEPARDNERLKLMRWDLQGFCAFASLSEAGVLETFDIQLPVA